MLSPLDPDLDLDARALAALARTRALGLHFLGHFLSVAAVDNGDGASRLVLDPPRSPGSGAARSATELSVLADLACGSAVRSALGPGLRLGTTALTLDHLRDPAPGRLEADALTQWSDGDSGEGQASCRITDPAGALVAVASAWFVALPPPPGRDLPPVPWEDPGATVVDVDEDDLEEGERTTLAEVRRAATLGRTRGSSVVASLVEAQPDSDGDGIHELSYRLAVGPAVSNRVGQMQGGALYGTATAAAETLAGAGWRVAAGHVQFLRPVEASSVLVTARTLRRGRRAAFTEVEVGAGGRPVLVGRFSHRPRADGD